MRRERTTRIGVCVLLLATVSLTGCRLAEHGRRAAIDAFGSFVLDSVFQMQSTAPLRQKSAAPPKVARLAAATPAPKPCPLAAMNLVVVNEPLPLPAPRPRIAAVDLAPRAVAAEVCRIQRVYTAAHVQAQAQIAFAAGLEARMALAQLRGGQGERIRRIVVIADPEIDPATL